MGMWKNTVKGLSMAISQDSIFNSASHMKATLPNPNQSCDGNNGQAWTISLIKKTIIRLIYIVSQNVVTTNSGCVKSIVALN